MLIISKKRIHKGLTVERLQVFHPFAQADVAHRYAVEHDGYDDAVVNIVVGYGVAHPVLYLGGRRDGCQPCEYEGDDEPCELNG